MAILHKHAARKTKFFKVRCGVKTQFNRWFHKREHANRYRDLIQKHKVGKITITKAMIFMPKTEAQLVAMLNKMAKPR